MLTGKDCPDRIGHALKDQYPIAREKVRYWGEPVASVVANAVANPPGVDFYDILITPQMVIDALEPNQDLA